MIVDVGRLHHRISILKPNKKTDDRGIIINTFCEKFSTWCSVVRHKSKEDFSDARYNVNRQIVFYIRFRLDIKENDRVSFDGQEYNITAVNDLHFEHRLLEIICERI